MTDETTKLKWRRVEENSGTSVTLFTERADVADGYMLRTWQRGSEGIAWSIVSQHHVREYDATFLYAPPGEAPRFISPDHPAVVIEDVEAREKIANLESRANAGSTLIFWLFAWNTMLTAHLVFGWPT